MQIERNSSTNQASGTDSNIQQMIECLSKCQRFCRRWKYEIQINRLPISINSAEIRRQLESFNATGFVEIELIFPNQLEYSVIEQIPTYNFHSFLSNIGGQVSLWSGASIVSVVHLLHFIVRKIFGAKSK